MNKREKAVVNTLILILPFLWSFLTQSDLNSRLKLDIICPLVLLVLLLFALSDKVIRYDKDIYGVMGVFTAFCLYAIINSAIHKSPFEMFTVLLTMSSLFSYIYLGQNIKMFGFISFGYAAISIVILADFLSGGLTAGWNTNSIGLVTVNGIYFLLLSVAIDNDRFWVMKIGIVALILSFISITDCRSALFGVAMYFVVRLFFIKKNISREYYKTLIIIFTVAPFFIMRLYLHLYNSAYKERLDYLSFKYTGKMLFTERELIWKYAFKGFKGIKFWFGNGHLVDGNAHNIYVDIWYTLGLVGVVAFGALIVYCMMKVYEHLDDRIIKSAICCFYGKLFSQTFECEYFSITRYTFNAILYMFIAIILGRYIALKHITKRLNEEEKI